ncbi:Holliday junction branch migration protein RuvA [Moraxella pluranimalium]|uniref:Holliday junction branch migration complex subunit RuvA n=1 Tax=Moraxella pluranimalium TaxID=470453 RepID=A0A1T0CRX9_9GAMM|nr:Holliday junction branch migration protein RuvA [Moraxella pluranimalium]OOS25074.1 Holliday junction branch migration protein RuvA [Moraxella pluranimalium]
MIGLIKGQVQSLNAPVACIVTSGGVGYEIELPIPSFCQLVLGAEVCVFTHLSVREDAHSLFGFIDKQDRDVFRKLIKINGVGAKMALAMLSTLSAGEIKRAVEQDNDVVLVRVPGIGKKTAQRIILDLKGKLAEFGDVSPTDVGGLFEPSDAVSNPMQVIAEVESALISLGYKEKEAQAAIKNAQSDDATTTQALLKAALRQLSGF